MIRTIPWAWGNALGLSVSRPHTEGPTWIFLGDYFGFLFDVSFDFWIFWHSSNRLEMHGMNGRVPRLFVFFLFFVLRRTVRKIIFLVAFKVFCVFFHRWSRAKYHIPVIQDVIHFGDSAGSLGTKEIFGQNINTFNTFNTQMNGNEWKWHVHHISQYFTIVGDCRQWVGQGHQCNGAIWRQLNCENLQHSPLRPLSPLHVSICSRLIQRKDTENMH